MAQNQMEFELAWNIADACQGFGMDFGEQLAHVHKVCELVSLAMLRVCRWLRHKSVLHAQRGLGRTSST